MAPVGRHSGRRPGKIRVQETLNGLRINQGITSAMLPGITFQPTLGITARRIDRLGLDIRSFREPLKRSIQQVVAPSFQKNFDVGGRPRWESLSSATIEIQQNLYGIGDHTPLNRIGRLRRVMGQFNIWTVTRESAILRSLPTSVQYGTIHQAGYVAPGGGGKGNLEKARKRARQGNQSNSREPVSMPPRPFVMLQEQDVVGIRNVFGKWFEERIDRAWPK